jgi:hypothetical protein
LAAAHEVLPPSVGIGFAQHAAVVGVEFLMDHFLMDYFALLASTGMRSRCATGRPDSAKNCPDLSDLKLVDSIRRVPSCGERMAVGRRKSRSFRTRSINLTRENTAERRV